MTQPTEAKPRYRVLVISQELLYKVYLNLHSNLTYHKWWRIKYGKSLTSPHQRNYFIELKKKENEKITKIIVDSSGSFQRAKT